MLLHFKVTKDLVEHVILQTVAKLSSGAHFCGKKAVGLHYNIDYPDTRDDLKKTRLLLEMNS